MKQDDDQVTIGAEFGQVLGKFVPGLKSNL